MRKKWLVREAVAEERDARRLEKVAVLVGRDARDKGEAEWRGVRLEQMRGCGCRS